MAYNANILLGKIIKASGYKGAVSVKLENYFSGKLPHIESVFLEFDGIPVPFFISFLEYSGADILKLKFEGYESVEKVSEFIGCRIFLTSGMSDFDQNAKNRSLIGYKVLTGDNDLLGYVKEVITMPGQSLLNVTSIAGEEILIPYHQDFIVSIDDKMKILRMNIPDGLTEIK